VCLVLRLRIHCKIVRINILLNVVHWDKIVPDVKIAILSAVTCLSQYSSVPQELEFLYLKMIYFYIICVVSTHP